MKHTFELHCGKCRIQCFWWLFHTRGNKSQDILVLCCLILKSPNFIEVHYYTPGVAHFAVSVLYALLYMRLKFKAQFTWVGYRPYYRVPIHVKSICSKFRYLSAQLGEREKELVRLRQPAACWSHSERKVVPQCGNTGPHSRGVTIWAVCVRRRTVCFSFQCP